MDKRSELLGRVYIVFFGFLVFACVILYKVFNLTLVESDTWRQKAEANLKWQVVEGDRGSIFSEDGGLLVASMMFFDVYMDLLSPKTAVFEKEVDSLAVNLALYSGKGKTAAQWKRDLVKGREDGKAGRRKGMRYYPIAKDLDIYTCARFKKFPLFRNGSIGGGLIIVPKSKRERPFGAMASRLLGLSRKNAQDVGIEAAFNEYLAGQEKRVLMKRVSEQGDWVPIYDLDGFDVRKGADVVTTIDTDIQDAVHYELMRAAAYHEADKATVIVMDVETGGIKAMSNLQRGTDGKYRERSNIAVTQLFEPGSTIKLASVLAMMDEGSVHAGTKVDLENGRKSFYGQWMTDSSRPKENLVDLKTAFAKSSNVGIAGLADRVFNQSIEGQRKFVRYFKKYGIGEKAGIDLIGEPNMYLYDPDVNKSKFSRVSVPWMAHGYEIKMSPLQVLSLYNAVANKGRMMKPYVVSQVVNHGEVTKQFEPVVQHEQIAAYNTIEQAQDMLREVVKSGTARGLDTEHYSISGKTGTAKDYGLKHDGEYPYNASFAGYFPSENPKYSMIVVLFNPKKHGYHGGQVAGPSFRRIADKIFSLKLDLKNNYYKEKARKLETAYRRPKLAAGYHKDFARILKSINVPAQQETKSNWVVLNPYNEDLLVQRKRIRKKIVPDVVGMGLRDAIYVLEKLGLEVRIEGVGKVRKQSIEPGTKIKGQEILIQLG